MLRKANIAEGSSFIIIGLACFLISYTFVIIQNNQLYAIDLVFLFIILLNDLQFEVPVAYHMWNVKNGFTVVTLNRVYPNKLVLKHPSLLAGIFVSIGKVYYVLYHVVINTGTDPFL